MPVSSDENSYQTEWLANSVKLTFFEDGKPDRVYILPFDQTDIVCGKVVAQPPNSRCSDGSFHFRNLNIIIAEIDGERLLSQFVEEMYS